MLRKNIPALTILLLAALTIPDCGKSGVLNTDILRSDPSFAYNIQPIFTASCALYGCHNSTARARLVLLDGPAYMNLVNVDSIQVPAMKRVLPGDATNSYLVVKVEGTQTVGTRMPQGRDPLTEVQIQNIKNWINRGARNN